MNFKKLLSAKILFILLAAGALGYVDAKEELKLGLDLKGGTQLDYKVDLSEVPEEDHAQIIEGVQEVIRKRVDSLGVAEPSIYTSHVADEQHIIVELAGISDIEEAKDTVGKTIQLEFREENTEPSGDQLEWANTQAQEFFNALQGGDFTSLAEAAQEENGLDVSWSENDLQDLTTLTEGLEELIGDNPEGAILGPIELNEGFVFDETGNFSEQQGVVVVQVTKRATEERETEINEEVSARHILIAYEGAERSDATRTKEEAESLANELRERVLAGESLADLATEYSDDKGSGENGGDLNSFGRGMMTENFENAAFGLEVGGVSELVETEFGYHIIEVYDRQEAGTEIESIEQVAYNKISFSTTPNPWKDEAALTGEHFKHADVAFDQSYQPIVNITFTKEGGELFKELTEKNINKRIAIFVGGELISAPNVNGVIPNGEGQINGSFSLEEAQELARDLNTGAIPAPVELAGQYTISATLGAEALNQSIRAGIIGLIILALFMLAYYRLPGLIADLALAIYSILMLFFIKIALPTWMALLLGLLIFVYIVHLILKNNDSGGEKFISFLLACVVLFFMTFVLSSPITLTLAGIAGVILSIGMAVDANVLIFERMREELAEGKEVHNAIEDGFKRAWDSIRDSNFSSLITCAILFYFGSSIIRGFALNLALGILVSMFSAIMLTRTFLQFSAEMGLDKKKWLFGMEPTKRHFAIIKNSRIWAAISGTLVTASIVVLIAFGLNLGLDFTGGTLMEVKLGNEEATTETVNEAITMTEESLESDFGTPQIVETDQGTFLIRLHTLGEEEHDALIAQLTTDNQSVEEIRFTSVGPTIGQTLKRKALIALAVTLVMIVFYIAFAFRKIPKEVSPWRFGISAIAALVHDVLIILGVFVLLGHFAGVELDALFITALLTIMGFSVHDTIVVFDRVRENLRYRESGEDLAETANKALNQTMARSINTSVSTLITILALLIWGANSVFYFVLALALGILVGTYSSLFVASPLLVAWNNWANRRK